MSPTPINMIPLRLNKRRDGSLVLTNAFGVSAAEDRAFPEVHDFGYEWLATGGAGVVQIENNQVILNLANAKAVYDIVDQFPGGVRGELLEADYFDAPPLDETTAAEIAEKVAAQREAERQRRLAAGEDPVGPTSLARGGSVHIEVPNETEEQG